MKQTIIKSAIVAVAFLAAAGGAAAQADYDFSALNADSAELFYKITGPQSLTVYGHVHDTADPSTAYLGTLHLPDTLTHDGTLYTVTAIGDSAFKEQGQMTGVDIPATVDSIGDNAFLFCSGLLAINIPEGVRHIGKYAFFFCNNASTTNIPSTVKTIDMGAFGSGGGNLYIHNAACTIGDMALQTRSGNVNLGDSVVSLGNAVFQYSNIHRIIIPQSVRHIGGSTFVGCMYLNSVMLPDCIDTIGDHMFEACFSLRNITLPPALKHIGESAFIESHITGPIELPATLQSIGPSAFAYATALNGFVSAATVPPTTDESAFTGINHQIPIVVPCGTIEAYSTAPGWEVFSEFSEDCDGIDATADLQQVSITPNPATDEATVLSSFGIDEVDVYDMGGASVLRQQASGLKARLDVKALPRGTYIVRIHTPLGVTARKLILQ